jgi:hypothetical protein
VHPYSSAYGAAVLYKTVWNAAEEEHEYEDPCPYQDGEGPLVTKQCTLVFVDMVGDAWRALQNGVSWQAVPTPWADRYQWDIPNADPIITTVPQLSYAQIYAANPLFKGGEKRFGERETTASSATKAGTQTGIKRSPSAGSRNSSAWSSSCPRKAKHT